MFFKHKDLRADTRDHEYNSKMKVHFYLRFHTEFGQSLLISGNTEELGDDDMSKALLMTYLNDQFWEASIELKPKKVNRLQYKYLLKTRDGEIIPEFGNDRAADLENVDRDENHSLDRRIRDRAGGPRFGAFLYPVICNLRLLRLLSSIGTRTCSTPFLNSAVALSGLAPSGSGIVR